jgi:hypothetical protein
VRAKPQLIMPRSAGSPPAEAFRGSPNPTPTTRNAQAPTFPRQPDGAARNPEIWLRGSAGNLSSSLRAYVSVILFEESRGSMHVDSLECTLKENDAIVINKACLGIL